MRHLDLFSGIGGFALAARRVGWETIGFCEIDPWCQKILSKHWPGVPIHDDIKTLRSDGPVDIITGGYPCQPFSLAGKRAGADDDRHLWPEMLRTIKAVKPRYVIGENVAGHITMGLDQVLSDLEAIGYTCRAFVIPACAVDAPHRRDRVWVIADSNSAKGRNWSEINAEPRRGDNTNDHRKMGGISATQKAMANTSSEGLQGLRGASRTQSEYADNSQHCRWPLEPDVGRVANGVPRRVDRLRGLGNAIVPQVAEIIFRAIKDNA